MTTRKTVLKRSIKAAVKVNPTLEKYGPFERRALLVDLLNETVQTHRTDPHDAPAWYGLTHTQQKALTEIADGISRVLNGDASCPDHWTRIARYAELALESLPQPTGE